MGMHELSREYRVEAAKLRIAVSDTKRHLQMATDLHERLRLQADLTRLTAMLRDTREVSRYLAHYYGPESADCFPSWRTEAAGQGAQKIEKRSSI